MQNAIVLGSTYATVQHSSFAGTRLVVVQPLLENKAEDGPPLIAVDGFGSRKGDRVMITSDGSYAREVTNDDNTPARWSVMGIVD